MVVIILKSWGLLLASPPSMIKCRIREFKKHATSMCCNIITDLIFFYLSSHFQLPVHHEDKTAAILRILSQFQWKIWYLIFQNKINLSYMFINWRKSKWPQVIAEIKSYLDGKTDYKYLQSRIGFSLKLTPGNYKVHCILDSGVTSHYEIDQSIISISDVKKIFTCL
jgi:hypothetical protein